MKIDKQLTHDAVKSAGVLLAIGVGVVPVLIAGIIKDTCDEWGFSRRNLRR